MAERFINGRPLVWIRRENLRNKLSAILRNRCWQVVHFAGDHLFVERGDFKWLDGEGQPPGEKGVRDDPARIIELEKGI